MLQEQVHVRKEAGRHADFDATDRERGRGPDAAGRIPPDPARRAPGPVSDRGPLGSLLVAAGVASLLLGGLVVTASVFPGLVARHVAPRVLYVPGPGPRAGSAPADHGLARGEEVRLTTSDGVALHGWWVPAAGPDPCGTVIYFHGNAGSLVERAFIARRLADAGFHALLVDYRGYGLSEGSPHEEGLYRDARAAWRHAVEERGTPPGRTVVAGHSLGSAVAARLASEQRERVGAAVLTGAFTSVPELAAETYRWLPDAVFRDWPTNRFETIRRVGEIRAPVLVARGGMDRLVPRSHTRGVYETAGTAAQWMEAPRAGHADLWDDPAFWSRLESFLEEALGCRG